MDAERLMLQGRILELFQIECPSRPLVAVANVTKSKIEGKFQLPQLKSKQLISPCAKVTLLRNVYFARMHLLTHGLFGK